MHTLALAFDPAHCVWRPRALPEDVLQHIQGVQVTCYSVGNNWLSERWYALQCLCCLGLQLHASL